MIRALRWRFTALVMAIVTVILLAVFAAMHISTRRSHERMSIGFLEQALSQRGFPDGLRPPRLLEALPDETPAGIAGAPPIPIRVPVLVLEVNGDSAPMVVSNQLHFLTDEDIAPLAAFVSDSIKDEGMVAGYGLRFLRVQTENGIRAAFMDTSMEQESLRAQMLTSLLLGGAAELAFFGLSLLLARRAVRPAELAWARQKEFVANASHELKTPVTVILSNAELLLAEEDDAAQQARRLGHIHAEALRMRRLVDDMLTLARSDETAAVHTPVDFSDVVTNAVLTVEPIAFDAGKRLVCKLTDGLRVSGDAARLHQVTRILLDNAMKYGADKGEITVELCRDDARAVLCVRSDGHAIPGEELERIFGRFYRGKADVPYDGESGFGLGLAIAEGIVAEHKGKIWAESNAADGNRFYVLLPLLP